MHAFEQIVARLFEVDGYWTRIGYYVELTKDQKAAIGKPSLPRPQIDVVAYRPGTRELFIIECKSFLDSRGVMLSGFHGQNTAEKDVYKLFNRADYCRIVTKALIAQLRKEKLLIGPRPRVTLALAAGKVYSNDESELRKHFKKRRWLLLGPAEIAERLRNFAGHGYEDDVATIVTKILQRNPSA